MYFQYFILILIVYGTTAQEVEYDTVDPNDMIQEVTNTNMVIKITTDATDLYYEKEEALPKEIEDLKDETGGETDTTEANDGLTNIPLEDTNGTLATNETTTTPAPKILCSNKTEWTCHDSGCIDNENICDGVIDCEDASDEYRETCEKHGKGKRDQLFGLILHCSSFWSENHKKACPEICRNEPEYCYYALNAEHGEEGTCEFPEFPENGEYTVEPNTTDSSDNHERKKDFRLRYNCSEPYVLIEEANYECKNGQWENQNATRYCSEACHVVKRENFTYECPIDRESHSNQCGNYVAINTTVVVRREVSENKISVYLHCKQNKEFNMTTDCVQEIDDEQNKFEKPTMEEMTRYETSFNAIKSNDTKQDSNFENLVKEFHLFEAQVKANLSAMHRKAEQCDIVLDLLLLDLEDKQKDKAASTPKPVPSAEEPQQSPEDDSEPVVLSD